MVPSFSYKKELCLGVKQHFMPSHLKAQENQQKFHNLLTYLAAINPK